MNARGCRVGAASRRWGRASLRGEGERIRFDLGPIDPLIARLVTSGQLIDATGDDYDWEEIELSFVSLLHRSSFFVIYFASITLFFFHERKREFCRVLDREILRNVRNIRLVGIIILRDNNNGKIRARAREDIAQCSDSRVDELCRY